ncbi:serine hydrolase domain-containing protein [Clostridium aminobutyricum]|uniref:Beta-lactamase family protein n=1 Tax=Clostridium aminobutyricum TaxID=33953 RepID=A0A939D8F9_CLOAM|nr:serine hydrolase domain-containing protein [Clostridium aminobutyricum]MBN7773015.1 beta-lactamase family protein [Clostridium aminobutyricum]
MLAEKLNNYIEEALFYHDIAGLAIGVTVGSNSPLPCRGLHYEKTAGYQDFTDKKTLKIDQYFHVASVTKLFVGTAILLLWEKGSLCLDAEVSEILPWFSIDDKRYKTITVRHLLTHTSGLTDVTDYGWDKPQLDEGALQRYCESDEIRKSKLLWAPEENRFQYSNMAYELLGAVIAHVSGMSFETFVAENILKPLDMKDTTLLTFERTKKLGIQGELTDPFYVKESLSLENLAKVNMAMPHTKNERKFILLEEQYPYSRAHGPSSTITTNLKDLERWARGHIEKKVLRKETYDLMWRKYALVSNNEEHIGLSWFIREQNGFTLYGHEGNDDGFRASFWLCPELDLHIAVLANLSQAPVKKINKNILELILKENNKEEWDEKL